MDGRHLIDTAVFEIGFRSEEEAFSRQGDLDAVIKGRLIPIVDAVFDELAPADGVVQLETLEIDLGEVSTVDLEQVFQRELRERLGAALTGVAQGVGGCFISEPLAELGQWQFYLARGRFPWDSQLSGPESIDQWLERILDSQGVEFAEILRRSSMTAPVVRRLVKQFSDELLVKVVSLLSGAHARVAADLTVGLENACRGLGLREADEGVLRDFLWIGLIETILTSDGPRLPPDQWLRRAFRRGDPPRIVIEKEAIAALLRDMGDLERGLGLGSELTAGLQRVFVEGGGQRSGSAPASRHEGPFGVVGYSRRSGELIEVDTASRTEGARGRGQGVAETEPYGRVESQEISDDIVRAYDLFDRLRELLSLDVFEPRQVSRLRETIDELTKDYPWQMLRFFRAFQAGGPAVEGRIACLPTTLLYGLVRSLISLTIADEQPSQSDLQRAVDGYSGRVTNRRIYYGKVLKALLFNDLLDLEQIVSASNTAPEPAEQGSVRRRRGGAKPAVKPFEELSTAALRKQVKRVLEAVSTSAGGVSERQIACLEHALRRDPTWVARHLERQLRDGDSMSRLGEVLPERLLTRVLLLLRPRDHARLQHIGDLIAQTCYASEIEAGPERIDRLKWRFLFQKLRDQGGPVDEQSFVAGLMAYMARELGRADEEAFRTFVSQRLALDIRPSTRELHSVVRAALWPERESSLPGAPSNTLPDVSTESSVGWEDGGEVAEHGYVDNAGVVLAAPYLPRLFTNLGLIGDTGFHDQEAAERAVHLIEYLVDERSDAPEYRLTLNKLLCGIEPQVAVRRKIRPTEAERELTSSLLQGMIQNWKAIGNTSVSGLRESFLQRRGRLQLRDDTWHLLVEQKAYDLLLDRLPWSYSMIKYSWMPRGIQVDWR